MKRYFLSFDLGASSGRAIVGTLDGGRLELTEVHRFENGHIEKDGSLMWNYPSLVTELKAGLKKALTFAPGIAGIGIDTWGVDYVLFDRDSRQMVRLPYHYRDSRTGKAAEKVHAVLGKSELYRINGLQYMPFNTVYQLAAHQEAHPDDFGNSVFLMMPDALALALGGDFCAEYTDCSTTGLLDPCKRSWNWDLTDKLGLPRSIFPEIRKPCSLGGTLSAELQQELGCGPIPIIKVGSHDTASAVAAVPASDADWAYLSCGTWALLGAEIPEPVITEAGEKAPFTNEGGLEGRIRFLTNIMGSWLMQETRRHWKRNGRELSFAEMSNMAVTAEPFRNLINPNDLVFMPPGDMPGRVREYCAAHGFSGNMSDAEVLRCLYDSLSLCFASKLHELEKILGTDYKKFHIVGGGTKDEELMQCTANVMGIPVAAGPVEATAIGNLMAQAVALGDLKDLAEVRKVVADSFELKIYQPDASCRAACGEALANFEDLCRQK